MGHRILNMHSRRHIEDSIQDFGGFSAIPIHDSKSQQIGNKESNSEQNRRSNTDNKINISKVLSHSLSTFMMEQANLKTFGTRQLRSS